MTNKQAIAYIESLMSHYETSTIHDKHDPTYRYAGIWISVQDMIALKMGIEALKSDKPSGKWKHISYYDGGFGMNETCSNCGHTIHGQIFDLVDKFCPNCGAKMDLEEE